MSTPAAGEAIPPPGWLRVTLRLAVMLGWLLVALLGFHLWKLIAARNPWPRRFLGGIARIAGVRIRIEGQPVSGRLLLLANHVSWIDIPALAGATGTAFVAHDGLAAIPLLRWLCEMNDTIFVARHDRTSVGHQIAALRGALAAKPVMTIFPESTTSDGSVLLPFRSSLLAALDPLPADTSVQPVWLDYGPNAAAIAWVGEEGGLANFLRILARARPLVLTIHFLAPLAPEALVSRKAMAAAAQQSITRAMANPA